MERGRDTLVAAKARDLGDLRCVEYPHVAGGDAGLCRKVGFNEVIGALFIKPMNTRADGRT